VRAARAEGTTDLFLARLAIGVGVAGFVIGPTIWDSWHLIEALKDPELAHYEISRRGRDTLALEGAINEESGAAILEAMESAPFKTLWITSHGGLVDAAERLAAEIDARGIEVVADGHCISACVMLLAASRMPSAVTETEITFHQPQEIIAALDPDNRIPEAQRLWLMRDYFARTRIPSWALERMMESEYWTPTFGQLVKMGLLQFVYERDTGMRIYVGTYCDEGPERCTLPR
jgi:hypothetical protein